MCPSKKTRLVTNVKVHQEQKLKQALEKESNRGKRTLKRVPINPHTNKKGCNENSTAASNGKHLGLLREGGRYIARMHKVHKMMHITEDTYSMK